MEYSFKQIVLGEWNQSVLRLGLHCLIKSISWTRQSNFPWHFFRMWNWLWGGLYPHGLSKSFHWSQSSLANSTWKHLILFSLRLVVSKAENLCLSFCCLVLFSYFVACIKVTLRPEFRIFFECNFIFVTCLNFYLYFVYLPSSIIL